MLCRCICMFMLVTALSSNPPALSAKCVRPQMHEATMCQHWHYFADVEYATADWWSNKNEQSSMQSFVCTDSSKCVLSRSKWSLTHGHIFWTAGECEQSKNAASRLTKAFSQILLKTDCHGDSDHLHHNWKPTTSFSHQRRHLNLDGWFAELIPTSASVGCHKQNEHTIQL